MDRTRAVDRISIVTVLAAVNLVLACVTPRFTVEFDEEKDFSTLQSFAWYPDLEATRAEERSRHPGHFAAAERGVEESLVAMGYRKSDAESADFLVSYTMSLEQRFDTVLIHRRYAMHGLAWELEQPIAHQETIEYEKGTLVLDVIDAREREIVWRGSASQHVYFGELPTPDTVERRASEILERFPPNP